MKELGPNEGMNALRHADCRFCDEYERLIRGVAAERDQLKEQVEDKPTSSSSEDSNSTRTRCQPQDQEGRYRKALEEILGLSSIDQAADGSGPLIVMRDDEMREMARSALQGSGGGE